MIRTQQQIKLNTGAKEIQQVNPGGPDKQPKHQVIVWFSIIFVIGMLCLLLTFQQFFSHIKISVYPTALFQCWLFVGGLPILSVFLPMSVTMILKESLFNPFALRFFKHIQPCYLVGQDALFFVKPAFSTVLCEQDNLRVSDVS